MEGGAGWLREGATSLYYKKMLVGPRDGQRMSESGLLMVRKAARFTWRCSCICEHRQEEIIAVLV